MVIQKSSGDNVLQFQLNFFDEITKLAYIIIENTSELSLKEYSSNVSLNTFVQTAINIFDSIKPE